MYTVAHYEAVIRYVYQKLIKGEGTGPEQWACILWLDANDKELLREYHKNLFGKRYKEAGR